MIFHQSLQMLHRRAITTDCTPILLLPRRKIYPTLYNIIVLNGYSNHANKKTISISGTANIEGNSTTLFIELWFVNLTITRLYFM